MFQCRSGLAASFGRSFLFIKPRFLLSALCLQFSVLSWNSFSGRVYTIYWASNLLSGFGAPWKTNITGGGYTDTTHTAEDKGFYKIEVELE